jgi:predicted amidohydrolase
LDGSTYAEAIRSLARTTEMWIVGGSHHRRQPEADGGGLLNCGIAVDPGGDVVAEYDKLNPYGFELGAGVVPGDRLGVFDADGLRVAVLICADFYFSELLHQLLATEPVDLIAVPSFSLTRLADPKPARDLWQHMAIARAYEFGAYVAVSDWAPGTPLAGVHSAGVAGFAMPHAREGERMWQPIGRSQVLGAELEPARLRSFRADRLTRGLLRKR